MIDSFPFLISFLIGHQINRILFKETKSVNSFLHFFLSIGTGLGVSSTITFFSFLSCGGFNASIIMAAHVCLIILLSIIIHWSPRKTSPAATSKPDHASWVHLFAWGFLAVFFLVIYSLAQANPYGEWDGWALWNMKAKFLFLSGDSWKNVFQKLHWHTQPDYPLLLPFVHVWGWTIARADFVEIPVLTSVIFTVSCAGLLLGGLIRHINNLFSFLACLILISLPAYIGLGISQYADIVLAYYLLASLILLTAAVREKDKGCAGLAGLMLGFMSFVKNEGMVISILLTIMAVLYLFFEDPGDRRANVKVTKHILAAAAIAFLPTVIFKLFLALPNHDIWTGQGGTHFKFLNWEGCRLTLAAFARELVDNQWHGVWFFIAATAILGIRRCCHKENKILSLFFIAYAAVILFVYLTTVNFDLSWRLSRTVGRILFYLLPAALFSAFYMLGQEQREHSE